jgi:hypothetical protein
MKYTAAIIKKAFCEAYYAKSFIRNNALKEKTLLIDSYNKCYNFNNQKIPVAYKAEENNIGFSLNFKEYLFKHKVNSGINFIYLKEFYNEKTNLFCLNKLIFILSFLQKQYLSSKLIKKILFLKPVKGGYICYFLGVSGFMPKTHFFKLLKKDTQFLTDFFKTNVVLKLITNQAFHALIKQPFLSNNITLQPVILKPKRRYRRKSLNTVFLSKPKFKFKN